MGSARVGRAALVRVGGDEVTQPPEQRRLESLRYRVRRIGDTDEYELRWPVPGLGSGRQVTDRETAERFAKEHGVEVEE